MKKAILFLVLGFLSHKAVYELTAYRHVYLYKVCIDQVVKIPESTLPNALFCLKYLPPSKIEQYLLYQPEFYKSIK